MEELVVEVTRTDEKGNQKLQSFNVPKDKVSTVLEALLYIKENMDPSLSFRYSCRMEICGSCGMEIDGKPHMACSTTIESLKSDKVKVAPMKHYKVIRDLAVDMEGFFGKYKEVKPYIIRDDDNGKYESEILQTPAQFDEFIDYSMCIKCGICMAACPIEGSDPDYLGPAPLTAIWRYVADSRDQGAKYRLEVASGPEGTSRCHFVGECTEACPKGVDPSYAIQKLRGSMVKYEFQSLFRRH